MPLYKDTPWNQNEPEWTKAYKNANKQIVGASKWLNEATRGDDFKKGDADIINPAQVEYILSGYLGGYFTVANQFVKLAETAVGEREWDWRSVPVADRLIKNGDETTEYRKLRDEYFRYKKEAEETARLLKKYENAADEGILKYAEKLDFLNRSKEYGHYEIYDNYKTVINDAYDELKEMDNAKMDAASKKKKKELEEEYYGYLRQMINAIRAYDEGGNK